VIGEPNIVAMKLKDPYTPSGQRLSRKLMPWQDVEGIKLSDEPDFATDLHVLGSNDYVNWDCFNVGRKETPRHSVPRPAYEPQPPDFASSKSECRLLCRPAIDHYFSNDSRRSPESMSCPEG